LSQCEHAFGTHVQAHDNPKPKNTDEARTFAFFYLSVQVGDLTTSITNKAEYSKAMHHSNSHDKSSNQPGE
jgi:hypothetical protein